MDKQHKSYSLVKRLRMMLWAMVLVPVLAGVAFFALYSSRQLQADAVQELNATLGIQRQFIEYFVSERVREIDHIAGDPRVLQLPPEGVQVLFSELLSGSPAFSDLVFVNESGRSAVDVKYPPGLDVSDREYFHVARQGRSFVSEALRSRRTGRLTLIVSAPVRDAAGRFRGLVYGSVPLDTVFQFVQAMHAGSSTRASLYQADGTLLSPAEPPARPVLSTQGNATQRNLTQGDWLFDSALAGATPEGIYHNHAGERVVGSFLWVLDGRWLLVAETPERAIMALHASVLAVPLAGALVLFLVFGPAALRLARSLEAPLARLEEHARSIEAGDFEMACTLEPERSAPEEIHRLNSAYCKMVHRVQVALEELRQATLTDPLTGVPNRKLMLQEGARLLEAALLTGRPVSFLMLDLDHFKRVNDTYGHAAGDEVLRIFSQVLGKRVRSSDIFARMGGEEFAVLASAGHEEALELAERIRNNVEALRIPVEGRELSITVSVGVATVTGEVGEVMALDTLMACADKAMYEAKNAGRNRVVSCAEPV